MHGSVHAFLCSSSAWFDSNVQNAVNSRRISGNLDSPEGGMEALLQAVVCQDVGHFLMCTNVFLLFRPHTFYATDHWLETKPC